MNRRKGKQHASRAVSAHSHDAFAPSPRVRTEHSKEYEDLKITNDDPDTYSRIAGEGYLQSAAIKAARKRRKRKRVLTVVAVVLFAILLVGGGTAFAFINNINSSLSKGVDSSLLDALVSTDTPEDPFYVLLLGTDGSSQRDLDPEFGGVYRSDSMMLARIDPKSKKVSIVSIPRDLKVDIEGHGTNKINAAHAFGGPAASVKAVSELAGVPISHYAEINFDGFSKIVDALGGIEVDVPIEIDDPQAGGHLDAGRQTLNGQQALILCRSRHAYDDYGAGDLYRAANQRMVLSAVAQKLLQSDAVTIASSIQSLADAVLTDMKVDQIVGVAQSMRGIDASKDIYTAVVPTTSKYIDNVWYEVLIEDEWNEMMQRINAGLPPTEEDLVDDATGTIIATAGTGEANSQYSIDRTDTIRIRNGNGTAGVSTDAEKMLKEMGYRNFDVGNADNFDYQNTLIIYRDANDKKYAEQIAQVLGVGEVTKDKGQYLFDSDFLIVIGKDWKL